MNIMRPLKEVLDSHTEYEIEVTKVLDTNLPVISKGREYRDSLSSRKQSKDEDDLLEGKLS